MMSSHTSRHTNFSRWEPVMYCHAVFAGYPPNTHPSYFSPHLEYILTVGVHALTLGMTPTLSRFTLCWVYTQGEDMNTHGEYILKMGV